MFIYIPSTGGSGSVATDTIFDAKGDIPAGTGSDTSQKLAVGTNGKQLYADSTQTTGLLWSYPPTVTKTGDYTVTSADETIFGNHATVALTITLPAASSNTNKPFRFKNVNAALMTIDGTSSGQITTNTAVDTVVLNQNQVLVIQSNGATWHAYQYP